MSSGAAATLKAALRENNITLEELCALSKVQAKKLPLVGDKVLQEAHEQYKKKHLVVEVTVRVTLREHPEITTLTSENIESIRKSVLRGANDELCCQWADVELV